VLMWKNRTNPAITGSGGYSSLFIWCVVYNDGGNGRGRWPLVKANGFILKSEMSNWYFPSSPPTASVTLCSAV
jgi:hypothetical protein